jgi:hypothetical protein
MVSVIVDQILKIIFLLMISSERVTIREIQLKKTMFSTSDSLFFDGIIIVVFEIRLLLLLACLIKDFAEIAAKYLGRNIKL